MKSGLIKPAAEARAQAVAVAERSTRNALLQMALFASLGAATIVLLATGRL